MITTTCEGKSLAELNYFTFQKYKDLCMVGLSNVTLTLNKDRTKFAYMKRSRNFAAKRAYTKMKVNKKTVNNNAVEFLSLFKGNCMGQFAI